MTEKRIIYWSADVKGLNLKIFWLALLLKNMQESINTEHKSTLNRFLTNNKPKCKPEIKINILHSQKW